MALTMDRDMEAVASRLWPGPQELREATGGLFNRVVQVRSSAGITYLKRFTDVASSGDFPPLPTKASQRCLVASAWHQLALRASTIEPRVCVPPLVAVDTALDIVAMESVQGAPLYESLVGDGQGTAGAIDAVTVWLAALHRMPLEPRRLLLAASHEFKAFKIDLQYTRVLAEVPQPLHEAGVFFAKEYLQCDGEPVHGDLNSRNILAGETGVSVIDFEQGHYGEGLYDLAYLLSEYVIRDLRRGAVSERDIDRAWSLYCTARGSKVHGAAWRRLRTHLAFQTLYRLVGPSRKVWTGHLEERAKDAVRRWSIGQLQEWLK